MKKFLYNFNRDLDTGPDDIRFITLLALMFPYIMLTVSPYIPVTFIGMMGLIGFGWIRMSYASGKYHPKENK